jgi:hypothetical protein
VTTDSSGDTEQRLRDALGALAAEVQPNPDAYRRAITGWKRRERKRRLIVAILSTVIFAGADAIGLWALNQAPSNSPIFSDSSTVEDRPLGRLGQP